MSKLKITILFPGVILFLAPGYLYAQLRIGGMLRNDAVVTFRNNTVAFNDILENRLVIEKRTEEWKFYGDGRLYLYHPPPDGSESEYEPVLMRSFIRYYSGLGDITAGKTYVNFGNMSIFNPFEIDKTLYLSDLSYDKKGILALELNIPLGEISGLKIYGGTENREDPDTGEITNPEMGGGSLYFNLAGFDFGLVGNRKGRDINLGGAYFKGDIVIGIQGFYALHFNDGGNETYHEASLGIDYSLFSGSLIISILGYYNESGADSTDDYERSDPGADRYLTARSYGYGDIKYIFDEFLNIDLGSFLNLVDRSSLTILSINVIIANGLAVSLQGALLSGRGDDEFSRDTLARYLVLGRIVAKF